MIALIRVKDGTVVSVWDTKPAKIEIEGLRVSPVVIGWEGDGYRVLEVTEPEIPEGKQETEATYSVNEKGEVVKEVVLIDKQSPSETIPAKARKVLAELGFTDEEIEEILRVARL